ncbi:MAG: hypothetical protein A2Z20_12015 [Bdellovibrionales bacterium RBG_16_40_8]|nr:MAG: hypothetical protein A2Z20_12015 [Bdellovibrionales bacterium RBG_16_40_8]
MSRYILSFIGFMVISGCAYRFGYVQRDLPEGYKQIAIPVFKNMTQEVSIERFFTNELIHQFGRSQVANVVSVADAPATIEGRITDIKYVPGGQVNGNKSSENKIGIPRNSVLTVEYRVLVNADIVLRRNSDQKVLWQGSFSNESVYAAPQVGLNVVNSVNALYNNSARINLIEHMAHDMMAEAHDRMTENF